ncbi:MAG: GUN4 domain-containing protein [Cyanobacteria bacterium P01_B01_bin.77]
MMTQREERIPREELLILLQKYFQDQEESIEAREFLEQVVQISELLIEQEDEIEFAHLSFREYLAATKFAHTQNETLLLYSHLADDWWKPTILLYAAQVNPTRLIRKMLEVGAPDLAYACWQDTTKRIEPTLETELAGLKKAVVTSRYQQLEDYLKNGQWQEADHETYRLMLTTVDKEEGQLLSKDDLLNFSCEELQAIDSLWVKYSDGKFGFSVQKDLYLNKCSGVPDGEYHEGAFWQLVDLVGWSSITYDSSSPQGHLPIVCGERGLREGVGGGGGFSGLRRVSFIVSRLVKCDL